MVSVSRRREWERVLVVLALILGVVAMHALVMPMGDDEAMPAAISAGAAAGPGPAAASTAIGIHMATVTVAGASPIGIAGVSSSLPNTPPDGHARMHLCLAVLAALVVLGLCALAYLVLLRRARIPAVPPMPVLTRWPRPPPRTAIRLAQLCVLRN